MKPQSKGGFVVIFEVMTLLLMNIPVLRDIIPAWTGNRISGGGNCFNFRVAQ